MGDFERNFNYEGTCRRKFRRWVSLSVGSRSVPGNFKRYLVGSRKGASLSAGALLWKPGGRGGFHGGLGGWLKGQT